MWHLRGFNVSLIWISHFKSLEVVTQSITDISGGIGQVKEKGFLTKSIVKIVFFKGLTLI